MPHVDFNSLGNTSVASVFSVTESMCVAIQLVLLVQPNGIRPTLNTRIIHWITNKASASSSYYPRSIHNTHWTQQFTTKRRTMKLLGEIRGSHIAVSMCLYCPEFQFGACKLVE